MRRDAVIEVSAADAWAAITRPQLLVHFFPGVTACRLDGDVRTVTLASGLDVNERIVTNDSLQRRFQYRIEGGFFREHLATVDVIELDPTRCMVVYASDAEPATMALILGGAMQAALDALRAGLEDPASALNEAISTTPPPDPYGDPRSDAKAPTSSEATI